METFHTDIPRDSTLEFVVRVRLHDDEVAIVLKGQLLIEYLITKIIEQKQKKPEKIIEKSRNYTFAKKIRLVYSMGLIPDYLLDNINRINQLRNRLAHNLGFALDKESMILTKTNGEPINIRQKKSRHPERRYLKMLCFITLGQLQRHMETTLKIDPQFTEPSKSK